MKKELPKVYEPQQVEGRIYEAWENAGCFRGDPDLSLIHISEPTRPY